MLYKPGDRVIVRSDLRKGKFYFMSDKSDDNIVTDEMEDFAGQEVTIAEISRGQYMVDVEILRPFRWTDDMFEGLAEPDIQLENICEVVNSLL